jgi:hypothetical protein
VRHHVGRGHARLRPADRLRTDRPGLVVPARVGHVGGARRERDVDAYLPRILETHPLETCVQKRRVCGTLSDLRITHLAKQQVDWFSIRKHEKHTTT